MCPALCACTERTRDLLSLLLISILGSNTFSTISFAIELGFLFNFFPIKKAMLDVKSPNSFNGGSVTSYSIGG
jgi:hypothetical protein